MFGMFQGCEQLEYLNLSNFNTSNVSDVRCMFSGCHKLKRIEGMNNFNTCNFRDMTGMFNECKELDFLDLSNFNTSNVNKMDFMFNHCN